MNMSMGVTLLCVDMSVGVAVLCVGVTGVACCPILCVCGRAYEYGCGPIACGRECGRSRNVCGREWGWRVALFCVGEHMSMGVTLLCELEHGCCPIVCGRSPNVCGRECGRSRNVCVAVMCAQAVSLSSRARRYFGFVWSRLLVGEGLDNCWISSNLLLYCNMKCE